MAITGREERLLQEIAQARLPDLRLYYRTAAPPVDLTAQSLEAYLEPNMDPGRPRQQGLQRTPLTGLLQSLSWTDEAGAGAMVSQLSGSLSAALPEENAQSLPIRRGSRISLVANAAGVRIPLWTMRSRSPSHDPLAPSVTAELIDQMDALGRVMKHWSFKKDKRHPNGWTADRITRAVAAELGIKVGHIEKGRIKIKKLAPSAVYSALDILLKAWQTEENGTGRRFRIQFQAGRLTVTPAYRRNPVLYALRDQIMAATLSAQATQGAAEDPRDRPPTRVIAHGMVRTGGKAKKMKVTVARPELYGLMGRVTADKPFGESKSRQDLEGKAKRWLARQLAVTKTASISHPGIPFIHPGDAVQLSLPGYGYSGRDGYIFVRSLTHSVQGSSYTMELDLAALDVSAAVLRDEIAAEKRIEKRKQREARK